MSRLDNVVKGVAKLNATVKLQNGCRHPPADIPLQLIKGRLPNRLATNAMDMVGLSRLAKLWRLSSHNPAAGRDVGVLQVPQASASWQVKAIERRLGDSLHGMPSWCIERSH